MRKFTGEVKDERGRYTEAFKEAVTQCIEEHMSPSETATAVGLPDTFMSGFRQLYYKLERLYYQGEVVPTLKARSGKGDFGSHDAIQGTGAEGAAKKDAARIFELSDNIKAESGAKEAPARRTRRRRTPAKVEQSKKESELEGVKVELESRSNRVVEQPGVDAQADVKTSETDQKSKALFEVLGAMDTSSTPVATENTSSEPESGNESVVQSCSSDRDATENESVTGTSTNQSDSSVDDSYIKAALQTLLNSQAVAVQIVDSLIEVENVKLAQLTKLKRLIQGGNFEAVSGLFKREV